jgi:hypothetical protein
MTHIQTDEAGWVVSAWDTDPELPDAVPYPDWPGWTPPAPGMRPRLVDGAVVWQDPRSLAELKAAKNAEINAARLGANHSGFEYLGKRIATDPLSRGDLDAVAAIVARTGALPAGWPGAWKATDNSFVPIVTVAAWDAFYGAMYAAGLQNFATAQGLKAQLADAATPAEIDSITWPEEAP